VFSSFFSGRKPETIFGWFCLGKFFGQCGQLPIAIDLLAPRRLPRPSFVVPFRDAVQAKFLLGQPQELQAPVRWQ
jgi:hypothetical protein